MRNRLILSVFLVSFGFVIEMTSCVDYAKTKSLSKGTDDTQSEIKFEAKDYPKEKEISSTSSESVSITLPDIITYFMSAF
tara:strand:+ start:9116 stop:9355 length:240 start_codon:yes stop_codon:yes gene_type:complete